MSGCGTGVGSTAWTTGWAAEMGKEEKQKEGRERVSAEFLKV